MARGQQYVAEGQWQAAIIEFRNVIQLDPQHGEARKALADAYMRVNDGPGALREYVRAADLLPNDADVQVAAGNLLIMAQQFEDAQARAEKALALDARNVDAQILKANAMAGLRDLEGAIALYEEAAAIDPSRDVTHMNMGAIQMARGKPEAAEAAFKHAVTAAPTSVNAHLALANFYWATRRQPEAEKMFKAALAIEPANLGTHRALGMFYTSTGRAAEAEPHFKAIAGGDDPAAKLSLAQYYVGLNRLAEAREVLQALLPDAAYKGSAMVRLATLDAIEGRPAEGLARLRERLTEQPNDVAALVLGADILRSDGKRDEAMTMIDTAIKADPQSGIAHLLKGRLLADADRFEDAQASLEEALRLEGRPFAAVLDLTRLHLRLLNTDRALDFAKQAVSMAPESADAHHLLARAYLQSRDLPNARTEVALLRKAFPNAPTSFTLDALVNLADGRTAAARASYQQALALDPGNVEALDGLARLDFTAGDRAAAAKRIEDTLARREPTVDLLLVAARTYNAAGRTDDAESALRRAIDLDPNRLAAYTQLGQFYASHGRLKEATRQFQDIAEKNPKSVAALTMVGMLMEAQGQPTEAEGQYRRALAVDSGAPVAANNLAYILVSTNGNLDEALALAQAAQQKLPNEPNISDTLGWIYVKKNLVSSALPHLEAGAKGLPNHPEVHYHLGMAYVQTGDWARAKTSLQRALKLSDTFPGVEDARKALLTVGG
jgi:tetratricopeptide (TPR) repeat protein